MNEGYTKVFVSLDGTEQQDFVLARAIKVAANNGAKLIIGHVIDSTALEAAGTYPVDLIPALEKEFRDSIAGQVAKACNQMIMVAATQACAEALRLANAHGLDLAALRRALMAGSAGSRVLELMGAKMAARDFSAGIEARLHHKDFAIVMDEASALGVPLPLAAQVWQQLNALMGAGWGREDTSSLLRVLER